MKRLTLTICLVILNCIIQAQDKIPAFGKIDKADLEMKDCDFDAGAEALVLIDLGELSISYKPQVGWVSEADYRVRIKVLKEKAVDRAQIKLRYRSKNKQEEIFAVKGISFNLDAAGKIEETDLDKKSIYEKEIDKEMTEISFALPNVRVGTVFEYRYKLVRKTYSYIPTWTFQRSIPVKYSACNLMIPEFFQFTTQTTTRQKMDNISSTTKGNWYIMHHVPGLKKEPFSAGIADYLQRVEFKLSTINAPGYYEDVRTTWPKIIDELLNAEVFGGELKKNIKGTKDLDDALKLCTSQKEKIRTVYKYVQRHMQWNEGYGIASYDGIKSAWDKKNGTITDINFILISLLKDAGIKAKPLLISTKDNGAVNTFYPFINQFNGVMAYATDGEDVYVMNAADKYNPFNLIPYDVAFTDALIVDKNNGGMVQLGSNDKFYSNVFFTFSIEPDGKLTGQSSVKSEGYARNIRMAAINRKRGNDIFEDNAGVNFKVDTLHVNNDTDELLPLEQKAELTGSVQPDGAYLYLPYNLFMGMGKNLFIEENRVTDIDFNFPRTYVITGTYYLPDDYVVNELPKNSKLIMPDTSIVLTRMLQKDNNIISFRLMLDVKASGYAADAYPYIKDFYKKMYAILDERIVLKKK